MEDRAGWEIHLFFAAWAACLVHPLLRRGRQAWTDQLALAAALFALLPVLNLLVTQRHLGITLAEGDRVRAGFDLGLLAIGLALGLVARMIARHGAAPRRRAVPLVVAEAAE